MRVLFDQGTPVPARYYLSHHAVSISADLGWDRLRNGDLLVAAEKEGFDLLLTTDKNLRYQQNLNERTIAIVVIGHSQWPALKPHMQRVVDAVDAATPAVTLRLKSPIASMADQVHEGGDP